jgi:hypothetical protein
MKQLTKEDIVNIIEESKTKWKKEFNLRQLNTLREITELSKFILSNIIVLIFISLIVLGFCFGLFSMIYIFASNEYSLLWARVVLQFLTFLITIGLISLIVYLFFNYLVGIKQKKMEVK